MRTPVFTGNCVAIATPFDASGTINYDAFGRLIDAQIAGGVDAICVCGTTGESATMTIREHIAAVEYCVKRVDHRVKVIAGAGSNDTTAAVYPSTPRTPEPTPCSTSPPTTTSAAKPD